MLAVIGGAGVIFAAGCASSIRTAPPPTPHAAKTAEGHRLERLRELQQAPLAPMGHDVIASWFKSQPASSLGRAFRQRFQGSSEAFRLVGTVHDHPAVNAVRQRASELLGEAVPSAALGTHRLVEARRGLAAARSRLSGAKTILAAQRARARVAQHGAEVELHAWRLAYRIAELLGGPVWRDSNQKTFEAELLNDPVESLARFEPKDAAYHALVKALAVYRRLAAGEGGRQTLGKIKHLRRWLRLKGGVSDSRVVRLRRRLEAEGFHAEAEKEGREATFDGSLVSALAAFQTRHHLRSRGRMDRDTIRALQRPVEALARDIARTIVERREHRARRDRYRLEVNIPAFELRVLDSGRVIARHRVVVGNNRRVVNAATGRSSRPNRTPTLASKIRSIVVSPAWRVPRRIKEGELDIRAQKTPEIYDDFRFYVDDRGVEWAVQLPGPSNALGLVKFVFPGGNGVFLHDTPRKRDFHRLNRALSHGCVRVDGALSLARLLLLRDNHRVHWSVVRQLVDGSRETPLRLNRPVPIHLTYQTVGVSPKGELRFYRDVYGRRE